MQFPLISRELIAVLKLVHGLFNLIVMLLFFIHARTGLLIRRTRTGNTPPPLHAIKRHRRFGPILALLGGLAFFSGLLLVMIDAGQIFLYPSHLFVGVAIVLLILASYEVSRKIMGHSAPQRDLHYRLGLVMLALYLVNVVLGIRMLL